MPEFGPLVSAEWLRDHRGEPDLRVVDLRWKLGGPPGREGYDAGHLPGAVFIDLDRDITAPSGPGRHPIPSREQFQAAMRRAGVNRGDRVVAYDDAGGSVAARLWWLLRFFGHERAAVLDGGLQAWGQPLEIEAPAPAAGDFEAAEPNRAEVVDRHGLHGLLLDARAPERYRGEVEPVDPKAGHIPGARSAFWQESLDERQHFKAGEELRQRFRDLGVESGEEVIAQCGSGVNAAHVLLALELAGFKGARLYEGSWSDWSSHPDAPVATGPEP